MLYKSYGSLVAVRMTDLKIRVRLLGVKGKYIYNIIDNSKKQYKVIKYKSYIILYVR